MKEIWKDITGYEGLYQVSNLGQVRSLNYLHTGKTRILKPGKDKLGYLRVNLYKDGERKSFLVHRLVANAFLPNPQNYPVINHRNENPSNNVVSNLEFCQQKYNMNYGTCIERGHAKLVNGPLAKPVLQYDMQGNFLKQWPSAHEVERSLGFNRGNICSCCRGELKYVNGFIWRYV